MNPYENPLAVFCNEACVDAHYLKQQAKALIDHEQGLDITDEGEPEC